MYINNNLRDHIFQTNVQLGFWDSPKEFQVFLKNLSGEFQEARDEIFAGRIETEEIETPEGEKKLIGLPTELSDVIIFVLDYFGGSKPQIDVDEEYLEEPDEYYKNDEYYEEMRQEGMVLAFDQVHKDCLAHMGVASVDYLQNLNNPELYVDGRGRNNQIPKEFHAIIKRVLAFADGFGIDMKESLKEKIQYNATRTPGYRRMGHGDLEEEPHVIYNRTPYIGYGEYKEDELTSLQHKNANDRAAEIRESKNSLDEDWEK